MGEVDHLARLIAVVSSLVAQLSATMSSGAVRVPNNRALLLDPMAVRMQASSKRLRVYSDSEEEVVLEALTPVAEVPALSPPVPFVDDDASYPPVEEEWDPVFCDEVADEEVASITQWVHTGQSSLDSRPVSEGG